MTPEILIGLGGIVLAGLTYFAGIQRGKRERAEDAVQRADERLREDAVRAAEAADARVTRVTETYLANTLRVANMAGALRAGVASLATWQEVKELCDRVDRAAETPVIPRKYREGLADEDLLEFFRELSKIHDWSMNENRIFELQEQLKSRRVPAV